MEKTGFLDDFLSKNLDFQRKIAILGYFQSEIPNFLDFQRKIAIFRLSDVLWNCIQRRLALHWLVINRRRLLVRETGFSEDFKGKSIFLLENLVFQINFLENMRFSKVKREFRWKKLIFYTRIHENQSKTLISRTEITFSMIFPSEFTIQVIKIDIFRIFFNSPSKYSENSFFSNILPKNDLISPIFQS